MKKKIFIALLSLVCALCCSFGLAACGGRNEPVKPTHTHNYIWVDNGDGTHKQHCSVNGCDMPDKYTGNHDFTNGNCVCGKVKPNESHTHSWALTWSSNETQHWLECSSCSEEKDRANHIPGAAATTTTSQTCTQCGYVIAEPIGHTHSTTFVPANSANCTESGNIDYYTCDCGRWFSDAVATNEIKDKNIVVVSALGHAWQTEWTVDAAATTQHTGSKSHHCSRCSEKKDITEIPRIETADYNVTFVLNYDGVQNEVRTTEYGLITFVPERTGYVFNGWWYSDGQTDSGYILSRKFDTNEVVTEDGLVLYAEWVEAATMASQLTAPSVSINQDTLEWDAVKGATGYNIVLYESNSNNELVNTTVTSTIWNFPSAYNAGYYNVRIRAIGDGISTVNSVYVTKSFAHKILGTIATIDFDISTSVLTWTEVKGATEYDLYVNDVRIDSLTHTTYDFSEYEVGTYSVRLKAKKEGYQTSTTNATFEKRNLEHRITSAYLLTVNHWVIL